MDEAKNIITATLENSEEWQKFADLNNLGVNEMKLSRTKKPDGRLMFPLLKVLLSGLKSDSLYTIRLQFNQMGDCQFGISKGKWSSGLILSNT